MLTGLPGQIDLRGEIHINNKFNKNKANWLSAEWTDWKLLSRKDIAREPLLCAEHPHLEFMFLLSID